MSREAASQILPRASDLRRVNPALRKYYQLSSLFNSVIALS
jgi:hypothetical protein